VAVTAFPHPNNGFNVVEVDMTKVRPHLLHGSPNQSPPKG
jgi:hypothetical protein